MLELIKQKGVKVVAASVKTVAASVKTVAAFGKAVADSVKTVAASGKTVAASAKTGATSEKNEIRKENCTGTNESLIPYLFDVEFTFDVGECHAANHFVSPAEIFLKYPQKTCPKMERNHPKKN